MVDKLKKKRFYDEDTRPIKMAKILIKKKGVDVTGTDNRTHMEL